VEQLPYEQLIGPTVVVVVVVVAAAGVVAAGVVVAAAVVVGVGVVVVVVVVVVRSVELGFVDGALGSGVDVELASLVPVVPS